MKNLIVHLRVYRGSKLNHDAKGSIQNENSLVKLRHNTLEWSNYLKNLKTHGFVKVEVVKIFEGGKEIQNVNIQKEVNVAFNFKEKKELTPEQKKIAELEAKIEALTKLNDGNDGDSQDEAELKSSRNEYQTFFDKKPHHSWSVEQIRQKIDEAKGATI